MVSRPPGQNPHGIMFHLHWMDSHLVNFILFTLEPSSHTMKSVSVIICTRNRASDLRATLVQISEQSVPSGLDLEVLVVDNGSSDDTQDVVQQAARRTSYPIRHVLVETPGKCYAQNEGLLQSTGDIILFTDDDVRVPQDWVVRMMNPMVNDGFDAVAGGVKLADHLERSWMQHWHRAYLASSEGLTLPINNFIGANMGFMRYVLDDVPGFDPEIGPGRLGLCDESHFADRLVEAGYQIGNALDVEVEHHCSPERLKRKSYLAAAEKLGRSMAYIHHHWRHRERPFTDSPAYTRVALLVLRTKLWLKRAVHPSYIAKKEGFASWENYYVREIAYLEQSLIERSRPRNYEKHGLQRLDEKMETDPDHLKPVRFC